MERRTGQFPGGACRDGVNFCIAFDLADEIGRF
jgi:hypothetical protein